MWCHVRGCRCVSNPYLWCLEKVVQVWEHVFRGHHPIFHSSIQQELSTFVRNSCSSRFLFTITFLLIGLLLSTISLFVPIFGTVVACSFEFGFTLALSISFLLILLLRVVGALFGSQCLSIDVLF